MVNSPDLPEELRAHYQLPGNFCAVSGFESIAKLEHLLTPNEFPLQQINTAAFFSQ